MALFGKKQASTPDYLSTEENFKGSMSYEGRKAFIRNETRLGLSKYKGTDRENAQAMRILAENPDILARYEAARKGIIGDTRKSLGVLRTEGAMDRATESSRANQKMVLGIAKDLNGRILEGGLFGVIFGGPKRQQWLAEIENDYPQAQGKLLPLIEQGFENAAWDAAKSGNANRFINFMKKIGRPFGAQDEARVRQIIAAPKTIKDRQEAIVETLLVGAVSYILTGGVGILLGKIRTPIPLHKADLPSKEAITQSLHGEGAREQSQAAHNEFWNESERLRTGAGTTERAKKLYGREAAYVLSAIEEFGTQIDVSSNWITSGIKKGRAKNLQRAQEFGPWDTQKTLASIKFKSGSPEEARRISLLEKLSQTQIVRGLAESGVERSGYTEMLNMMSGCGSEEVFLEKYVLPSEAVYGPNVKYIRQAIHAFYHGGYAPYRDERRDVASYRYQAGDQRIIYSLVHSRYTPGVVHMINAYRGNPEKWKTANDTTTGGIRNVREKTQAYSREALRGVDMSNSKEVARIFREYSVNGISLADIYSRNLRTMTGVNITPAALVRAIENGQYTSITATNTWRDQSALGNKLFSGNALVFKVRDTSGKYRICGIKKDCGNLLVDNTQYTPESYLENLPATVYFRMPLILQLKPNGGRSESPEKPTKPGKPETPQTPGKPITPGETPRPATPTGPDSVPTGNVTPATNEVGIDASGLGTNTTDAVNPAQNVVGQTATSSSQYPTGGPSVTFDGDPFATGNN